MKFEERACVIVHDMILLKCVQKRPVTFFVMKTKTQDEIMKFGFKITWFGLVYAWNCKKHMSLFSGDDPGYCGVKGTSQETLKPTIQSTTSSSSWRVYVWEFTFKSLRLFLPEEEEAS
ncbi:unnamed protein product [Cochlearia groenlandica]